MPDVLHVCVWVRRAPWQVRLVPKVALAVTWRRAPAIWHLPVRCAEDRGRGIDERDPWLELTCGQPKLAKVTRTHTHKTIEMGTKVGRMDDGDRRVGRQYDVSVRSGGLLDL